MQISTEEQFELFPTESKITIPLSVYTDLLEANLWLEALEAAGVDSWEGISEAHEIYQQMRKTQWH